MEIPIKDYIKENYVSKKKIRAKVEELLKQFNSANILEAEEISIRITTLENLLKEEEKNGKENK